MAGLLRRGRSSVTQLFSHSHSLLYSCMAYQYIGSLCEKIPRFVIAVSQHTLTHFSLPKSNSPIFQPKIFSNRFEVFLGGKCVTHIFSFVKYLPAPYYTKTFAHSWYTTQTPFTFQLFSHSILYPRYQRVKIFRIYLGFGVIGSIKIFRLIGPTDWCCVEIFSYYWCDLDLFICTFRGLRGIFGVVIDSIEIFGFIDSLIIGAIEIFGVSGTLGIFGAL